MKDREREAKVMWFVREIGSGAEGKARTVSFDFTSGLAVLNSDEATHAAPAAGLF